MRRTIMPVLAVLLAVSFLACGADHDNLPTAFECSPPPVPVDLSATVQSGEVLLAWGHADPGIVSEYRVYYFYEAYGMIEFIGSTTEMQYRDDDLVPNVEYCYVVSAVDTNGLEGYRTESLCAVPPID